MLDAEKQDIKWALNMQKYCVCIFMVLSGGLRRQVISEVNVDSIVVTDKEFCINLDRVEKTTRGKGVISLPLCPALKPVLCIFINRVRPILSGIQRDVAVAPMLYKEFGNTPMDTNKEVRSLWISKTGFALEKNQFTYILKSVANKFHPHLTNITPLTFRRMTITSIMNRLSDNGIEMEGFIAKFESYLNTSKAMFQKHYNRGSNKETFRSCVNVLCINTGAYM